MGSADGRDAGGSEGSGNLFGLTLGTFAAIATIVVVGMAVSLMTPLVALTLAARGTPERLIGLVVSTYAVALLLTAPMTARVARRFGAANSIVGLTVLAALLIPFVWLIHNAFLLFPVIFVYGACVSLCFTLSEFWITANTPNHRRGFIIGLYSTLLSIGFAIGPAIISIFGASTIRPFLIGSALMIVAAVPAFAARHQAPLYREERQARFSSFLWAVPTATLGVLVFAMGESGGFAFLPIWGEHLGYPARIAVLLASAMTLGNVAFQIPLGLLADRADRRVILLVCGAIGALGMLLAWSVAAHLVALIAVLFVWGGVTAGIYTVGLAHLTARFSGGALASANAAFVFCYGIGMLIGPALIGDATARAPLYGFPLVLGVAFTLYTIVVALRMRSRRDSGGA